MIPDFNEHGNLPPGIHLATIDEVVERFGSGSPERDVEVREMTEFVEWAKRAGVRRLMINGSFVTDKTAPNDVDVVIQPGPDYPKGESPLQDEHLRFPFLQVLVAADDADFEAWALEDFGTDREMREKGVVELKL